MKKVIGLLAVAGTMAFSGLAVADDGVDAWWHKWGEANPITELECSATGEYVRPKWHRFLGLGATESRKERMAWLEPGGVDLLREILKRNPDSQILLGSIYPICRS